MTSRPDHRAALDAYDEAGGVEDEREALFQSVALATERLTGRALTRRVVLAMIKRRAASAAAGLPSSTCCHTFRATGDHHGVSVERGDPRARPADRGARVAQDDEALRSDGGQGDGGRDRTHRDPSRLDRAATGRRVTVKATCKASSSSPAESLRGRPGTTRQRCPSGPEPRRAEPDGPAAEFSAGSTPLQGFYQRRRSAALVVANDLREPWRELLPTLRMDHTPDTLAGWSAVRPKVHSPRPPARALRCQSWHRLLPFLSSMGYHGILPLLLPDAQP